MLHGKWNEPLNGIGARGTATPWICISDGQNHTLEHFLDSGLSNGGVQRTDISGATDSSGTVC